uniref:ARAD1D23870p n=1 Tax=Blastobotrys adeninivorans TaxID=409370 RepID=A0A060TA26_BLAAD
MQLRAWIKRKVAKEPPPCTCTGGMEPQCEESLEYCCDRCEVDSPVSGRTPILLPNEMLLQRFPNKYSALKPSQYRAQEARLKCRRCTSNGSVVSDMDDTSPLEDIAENDPDHIVGGSQKGAVYVTTERIIFIPDSQAPGYSISIEKIDCMKALESADVWYFVCYLGQSVSTIPFTTQQRAKSFLKLISNIRFEHMVRHCLPPKYSDNAWEEADATLPSYGESEAAVRLYLVSRGLLEPGDVLDRHQPESGSIIALAAAPPSDEQGPSLSQVCRRRSVRATTLDDYYSSPFVWF